MFQSLGSQAEAAVLDRLTLLLNHLLMQEPQAARQLLPHAGKSVLMQAQAEPPPAWAPPLPRLPDLAWRITPAGLLERCGDDTTAPDLTLRVALGHLPQLPLRLAAGQRPDVDIQGDAELAAAVNWLLQNLRWDLANDLERVLPPPAAALLLAAGRALAGGLQAALQAATALRETSRSVNRP